MHKDITTEQVLKMIKFTESIAILELGHAPSAGVMDSRIIAARKALRLYPCPHQFPNGTDAFELVDATHKEVYKCKLCGETTTA